jgi:hypothetical protein
LVAVIGAVLILINPEFLALGLLGDAAFVDLLVLLLSLQLQMVGAHVRRWTVAVLSIMRRVMAPRLSYIAVLSVLAALQTTCSTIQKAVHRLFS